MNPLLTMRRGWLRPIDRRFRSEMRIIPSVLIFISMLLGPGLLRLSAADDDGVALGILYDTSGSMREPVPDSKGSTSPKYIIANRALAAIVNQIQTFTTNSSGAPRHVDVGLFTFAGDGAKQILKLGPSNADAIRTWAQNFNTPKGGTPLGNALKTVSQAVLDSPQPRKHVLIITDGMNTVGPDPAAMLPGINRSAEQKNSTVFVHFIAFDVDAKDFDGVKKEGATVAAAADENQLNSQLDFILQNQILLEKPSTK
jgi:hypothetical protein